MSKRRMYFADNLYSSDPLSASKMIHNFNYALEETPEILWRLDMFVTYGIIVPHGAWNVSGFTANMAYRVLAGSPVDTVVVIGPSHHVGFKGISVAKNDSFETPLGDIRIDQKLVDYFENNFDVTHYPLAHREHSTEVQMPFIRHYLPNAMVIELVYGFATVESLEPIVKYLLENRRYAVVMSTDLSHFHTQEDANFLDMQCIEAITRGDCELLKDGCEACGSIGVEAFLLAAQKENLEGLLLDYATSADTNDDTSSVVGYMSAIFQEKL
ncbi:MAG: AmmeMemoRadiSam system protein [Campylobacterota bacterium]|nr:AmmeMemoRadiSam system protein [Campylobacterota bacterium]